MKKITAFFYAILNFGRARTKWIIFTILLIVFLFGMGYVYEEINRLPPGEAVRQSLDKTLNVGSYRFRVTATRLLEGNEMTLSDLYGQKSTEGIHLQGSLPLIKADVEIYHLGGNIYRKDAYTQGWVVVPDGGRVGTEQLIAELNPLGAFHFTEDNFDDVKYAGKEKVGGQTCRVYEVMTRGENKYLELFWQDFNYIIWVDKKEGLIRQAQVSAEHRDNACHILSINISLSDFNTAIELKAPVEVN